ncbi:YbaN family protein [Gimesia panareensis]|uniref:Inner membrane protein YbaN n=1 Tax=Gimesia panareensis TaxID=2527978 RepID=A0A518A923_9PLAN|nr:YbaN family protein [Gimesia panareensis]QDT28313.1 Inner membrane protein YbaN [Gimesia panareensis]QDU51184.1 Inner membrane protein YbaN [Gimesia panareensis]
MLRKSQPHQQESDSSPESGMHLDRIAFDEIHPAFLDTLDEQAVPTVTGLKKGIYLVLATFFFLLGVLGVALPVLPTTPFLLLTSYFLIRTSPRLNQALLRSPVLGQVLKEWQQDGGVRLSVKIQAISIVVLIITATLIFSPLSLLLKSVLVALACVGILVVIRLPGLH